MQWLYQCPSCLAEAILKPIRSKISMFVSNVPGPQRLSPVKGIALRHCFFAPPIMGNVGVGVTAFSYSNGLWVAAGSDLRTVKSPDMLLDCIMEEFQALKMACGCP